MGLLDEAIREHLDLKRRRGADATEVAAQEQEALGPVVREAQEPGAAAEPPFAPAADELYGEEAGVGEEPAEVVGGEAVDEDAPLQDAAYEPAAVDPAVAELAAAEPAPEVAHQETVAYDVESALAAEGGVAAAEPEPQREAVPEPAPAPEHEAEPEEAEDVLEETPDFLSETPEHDRLWFEQKPPKDFDF